MKFFNFLLIAMVIFSIKADTKPNIVLILIDDLGLTDLGAYGSEIDTPNIDALAKNGLIFTNYHATSECAPSRAMLLTGMDNHNTGLPMIPEVMPRGLRSTPGYEGYLVPEAKTIAEILQANNYNTYMTGKWHLGFGGEETAALPFNRGFKKTFILDATGGDNYSNHSYLPYYTEAPWFENGKPTKLPENFYSSKYIVYQMISYITNEIENDKPFFSYLSFQAQHIPLQAPKKFTNKYLNLYKDGWEMLREKRLKGAIEKGVFPADKPTVSSFDIFDSWDATSSMDKDIFIKSAAVFAGMLNALDFHLGRFVEFLKREGLYEDTIFIVTSDNGPEGNDPSDHVEWRAWIETTSYNRDYETLGEENSYVFIGTEFAQAMAAPSHLFKFHMHEGGLKVPLIISGPNIKQGRYDKFTFITDIAPTISDIIGVQRDSQMIGKSLIKVLAGDQARVYKKDEYIGLEVTGNSALFKGDYKIVRNRPPIGDNKWYLFNLSDDPGETNDLSISNPEILDELISDYNDYVKKNGVVELPKSYSWVTEMTINTAKRRFNELIMPVIAVIGLVSLVMFYLLRRKK